MKIKKLWAVNRVRLEAAVPKEVAHHKVVKIMEHAAPAAATK
jgi:hypothetical protein